MTARWLAPLVIGVLVLAGSLAVTWKVVAPPSPHAEIAVFFPSTDSSGWRDFTQAVRIVSQERGLTATEQEAGHSFVVDGAGPPLRFHWYPEIGSSAMRYRVREICRSDHPPLAIVGTSNTSLTDAIGREIHESSRPDWVPLLLMTSATTDELIDVNPDRTFRFGFNNSYQARAVVRRYAEWSSTAGVPTLSPTRVVVAQALDNPFSLDLARQFEAALRESIAPEFIPPPAEFASPAGMGASVAWSLSTATGSAGRPSIAERALARAVDSLTQREPDRPVVLVLPFGGETFTNIAASLREEESRRAEATSLADRITILTGDSLELFDFVTTGNAALSPRSTPGRIVFFSHVDPMDPTIAGQPDEHRASVSLNCEVVRSVLDVLLSAKTPMTPEDLANGLGRLQRSGSSVFRNRERVAGGGAIMVWPDQAQPDTFAFDLPEGWSAPERP